MDNLSELKKVINKNYRKIKIKRWPCFYPKCTNPSVGSHSQSVSSSLKSIAEDRHVMERNMVVFPIRERQGWRKIGINKTTKFPGFCKTHDNVLFKQADSISSNNLTRQTLAYLSFRTFAMEMRKKEVQAENLKELLKHSDKFIDPTAEDAGIGLREGMLNCLKVTKPFFLAIYLEMVEKKGFSLLAHKVFLSKINLGTSCATAINPIDMAEQPIDKPQPITCFNILPRKKYTLLIFSYPRLLSTLIDEFIKTQGRLEDLLFNYCEEVVLNISLYNSLNSLTRDAIEKAQLPWSVWQHTYIPDMFDFKFNDDSIWREF